MIVVILAISIAQNFDAGWGQIINMMEEAAPNMPKRWSCFQGPIERKISLRQWTLVSPCEMMLTRRLWTEVTDWVVVHPSKKGGTVTVVPCGC
jgi:hypothetical protein